MTSLFSRLIGAFSLVLFLTQPVFAQAGAVGTLTPSASSVGAGDFFTVGVFVDPKGTMIDTVRLELTFSPDIFAVQAVTPTSLLPYASPGNSIDNTSGTISFGAFTLGDALASQGQVAQVTLKALKAGTGKVQLLSSSLFLENGENVSAGGASETSVTVTTKVTTPPTGSGTSNPPPSSTSSSEVSLGSGTLTLTSTTHPDTTSWYASRAVNFLWTVQGATAKSCFGIFDESPSTLVTSSFPKLSGTEASFTAEHDGVFYFHLSCTDTNGHVSSTVTFPVRIDATPPASVTLDPDSTQFLVGEDLNLSFGARDDASGLAGFALSVNGGEYGAAESPFTLKNLPLGDTLIALRVTDNAGNSSYTSVRVRAYDKNSPFGTFLSISKGLMKKPLSVFLFAAIPIAILIIFCGILFLFVLLKRKFRRRI